MMMRGLLRACKRGRERWLIFNKSSRSSPWTKRRERVLANRAADAAHEEEGARENRMHAHADAQKKHTSWLASAAVSGSDSAAAVVSSAAAALAVDRFRTAPEPRLPLPAALRPPPADDAFRLPLAGAPIAESAVELLLSVLVLLSPEATAAALVVVVALVVVSATSACGNCGSGLGSPSAVVVAGAGEGAGEGDRERARPGASDERFCRRAGALPDPFPREVRLSCASSSPLLQSLSLSLDDSSPLSGPTPTLTAVAMVLYRCLSRICSSVIHSSYLQWENKHAHK